MHRMRDLCASKGIPSSQHLLSIALVMVSLFVALSMTNAMIFVFLFSIDLTAAKMRNAPLIANYICKVFPKRP
jgi:hypothetical protein